MSEFTSDKTPAWHWWVFVAGVGAVAGLLYRFLPVGVDFAFQFWRIPRNWLLEGLPVYGPSSNGFYNPPWTVLLLLPFSLPPLRVGMVLLTLFSVAVLLLALRTFAPSEPSRFLLRALALCNLHTFDLLQRGQIDAFALLGLSLSFHAIEQRRPWLLSAALVLLSAKPVHVLLPALTAVWPAHRWPARDVVKALCLPLLTLVTSFPLFGWDWPTQWWASFQAVPPQEAWLTTIWRALVTLDLPVSLGLVLSALALGYLLAGALQIGWGRRLVAIAQSVNLVITPYALAYNYVLILGATLPQILARSRAAAFVLWALSFLPLLRLWLHPTYWWIDVAFPIAASWLLAAGSLRAKRSIPSLP